MAELWHPEQMPQSHKAASLAAREAANVRIWRPSSTEYGHSAAVQAARAGDGLSPKLDHGYTAEGKRRSLKASSLAMSGSRRRADSTPVAPASYPDAARAGYNALQAASAASGAGPRYVQPPTAGLDDLPPSLSASRIQNAAGHMPRDMFTSHPPVGIEVEERQHADALRSAALSMAKQMYDVQQKTAAASAAGVDRSISTTAASRVHHARHSSRSTVATDASTAPPPAVLRAPNLEEAARKLAAERLAKLQDELSTYRDYYGTGGTGSGGGAAGRRSSLSLRARTRRRATSLSGTSFDADEDEARMRRAGAASSIFKPPNAAAADADAQKRQRDREALLAAAQRNVRASLHGMDERVFAETGRVPPSLMEEWERKARATAEADGKKRMANYGRVDIGGGRYVDRSEVEAAASRNVQPLLDEINEKAERHRAQEEEKRLDREQAKREAEVEKTREREVKTELKKSKGTNFLFP